MRVYNILGMPFQRVCHKKLTFFLPLQEDVVQLLGEEMKKTNEANGFVIDGFPANLNQGLIIFLILLKAHFGKFAKSNLANLRFSRNIGSTYKASEYFYIARLFEQNLGSPSHIIKLEVVYTIYIFSISSLPFKLKPKF